jgi:hypothetical protein
MTASAVAAGELLLPEPVGLQPVWLNSASPKKVLRVGRRGTKTRFAFFAALMGHGPGWEENAPLFPGVLQGGDVIWFAQTYTNLSTVLWHEEIVPRMGHLPWVELRQTPNRDVVIPGLGSLMLRSADATAIQSVRGAGSKLRGVIIDEAAWLALRAALLDIILPALLDNDGWLILMSTTNAGPDGGYDDQGVPQVPSYFNVICEEIRAGQRSDGWEEFYGTAFDNPTINPAAINELIAEYPADSPKLKQEVYAELLRAGIGLALEQVCEEKHLVPVFKVPTHWPQFGAFDWGFNHPYVFGWFAAAEDGGVVLIDSIWGRGEQPNQIFAKVDAAVPLAQLRYIAAGRDLWDDQARARGLTGPTLFEQFTALGMQGLIKASTGRIAGLNNFRLYVQWRATEHTPEQAPRFTMLDTPGNRRVLKCLTAMQVDPKNLEDALGVDADHAGHGGDDGYDMLRYGLMSRPIAATPVPKGWSRDVHPGIDSSGRRTDANRKAPSLTGLMMQQAAQIALAKGKAGWRMPTQRNAKRVEV